MNKSNLTNVAFGKTMLAIAWLIAIAFLIWFFNKTLYKQTNPNQNLETITDANNIKTVILQRNNQGHYVLTGKINDKTVTLFVDTGATVVAIPEPLAKKLNLQRGIATKVETANGITTNYITKIYKLEIGSIVLYDVSAAISPDMDSDFVLLGMSALKHLEFTQRGDSLIIKQYNSEKSNITPNN